jgi:hypothetical protein
MQDTAAAFMGGDRHVTALVNALWETDYRLSCRLGYEAPVATAAAMRMVVRMIVGAFEPADRDVAWTKISGLMDEAIRSGRGDEM